MATSDERREVAEMMREAAVDDGHIDRPYGEQGMLRNEVSNGTD